MVSFYCETCCATLKKPKLDQHAQRCWAVFTCIDCSTTFQGTDYRAHTSCMTEAEKYEKTVYKGPKHKNEHQRAAEAAAAAAKAAPAPSAKRARDDDATSTPAAPAVPEAEDTTPSLKKQKKDAKKAAKAAAKAAAKTAAENPAPADPATSSAATPAELPTVVPEAEAGAGDATAGAALAVALEGPDLKGFLKITLDELVKEARSLAGLREVVVEKAKAAGFVEAGEVEKALFEAVWVGGEKPKKRLEVRL